jgi:hypothetical protein
VWVPFGGRVTTPIVTGLIGVCVQIIMTAISVFILSLIIDALAPTFGGQKNSLQALKVAAYSMTASWVAGVMGIIPMLGWLITLIGGLYGIYLLYLGLSPVMKNPVDKSPVYTVVVVVCAIVLFAVTGLVMGAIGFAGMAGAGMLSGGTSTSSPASDVQFDKDSPLGRLQELSSKMEESTKKMEEAEKRGDTAGQTAAAFETLGTLLGGGKRVDPLGIDVLKPFVPETFAGLPRTRDVSAEKTGMVGMMVSNAEGNYGSGDKQASLEISDTGGVSGLVGLATWANVQGEKDDETGTERTQKVGGRMVHERHSKNGGTNEYSVILGDRFVVAAKSSSLSVNELKSAVSSLDLGKLEGMKDVGVTK